MTVLTALTLFTWSASITGCILMGCLVALAFRMVFEAWKPRPL